jgi:predicted transcriptional regulator
VKQTCFVIQVFDNGPYDRRYEETFAPAIASGGALALRADRILGSKPIIEKIEGALRDATIAFAEISENNPNVFIELGYALEIGIPLVMVCDRAKRPTLPFDIGHRPVIFYKTETAGDFQKLKQEIETAISAALIDATNRVSISEPIMPVVVRQPPSDALRDKLMLEVLEAETGDSMGISAYSLTRSLANDGYSNGLASLAILALIKDDLIVKNEGQDRNGDPYVSYSLTESGRERLLERYAEIKRSEEENRSLTLSLKTAGSVIPARGFDDDLDDDVPF